MFLKIVDFLKQREPTQCYWRGKVVDNNDPQRLYRLKVKITGLFPENAAVEDLPWIYPASGVFGAKKQAGLVYVPEVGDEVEVFFPNGDVYNGYWQYPAPILDSKTSEFDEDYPNTYGFRDSNNNVFRVNKYKGDILLRHKSGAAFRILNDSEIQLRSAKGIRFTSLDGKTNIFFDLEKGTMNIAAREEQKYEGKALTIENKQLNIDVGKEEKSIKGAKILNVYGGRNESIGGSDSLSVVGNRSHSIGGNDSRITAGKTERTYGQEVKEHVVLGDYATKLNAGDRKIDILLGNYKINLKAGDYKADLLLGSMLHDLKKGDVKYKLLAGDFVRDIVMGDAKTSIKTGNIKNEITSGNYNLDIKQGNVNINMLQGNCSIKITTGNYEVSLSAGNVTLKTPTASLELANSGDIVLKSVLGKMEIKASGEVLITDGTVAKLRLAQGQVGLGTPTCEIVDTLIKILDAFINQPNVCMTGVGPSGPLLPPLLTQLVTLKMLLTSIKGGV